MKASNSKAFEGLKIIRQTVKKDLTVMMKNLFLLISGVAIWATPSFAQLTKIGGVVNTYSEVINVRENDYTSLLDLKSPQLFEKGDMVLIIQMKGAEIDTSNTEKFGEILDVKDAGNFEFNMINGIIGGIAILENKLSKSYDENGSVQLVKIPQLRNAIVTEKLTAKPWDGKTGGVLCINVEKNLDLRADVDVSGKGFRGGYISNNPDGFCNFNSDGFYYPLVNEDTIWTEGGAMKGEGIANLPMEMMAGRGAIANGGGGGNKHNAGGGGGANFTAGGKGGDEIALCKVYGNGGYGGNAIDMDVSKVFMGGGGGCGDANDNAGTIGANGGGIVIISAAKIIGNRNRIKANGASQVQQAKTLGDGAGGGGAGGTVYLDVEEYEDSLYIEAKGGNGGNISENVFVSSFGPGGGGGSGLVLTKYEELPGYVVSAMGAGKSGLMLGEGEKYGTVNGATEGVETSITHLPFSRKADPAMEMVRMEYGELMYGSSFVMDKVQFSQGKYELTEEAKGYLIDLVEFLKSKPGIQIELAGHTDNVGDPKKNFELSENRVEEVKSFLVENGIPEDSINTVAYGGEKPIASNKYLHTRVLNRRVELRIVQ